MSSVPGRRSPISCLWEVWHDSPELWGSQYWLQPAFQPACAVGRPQLPLALQLRFGDRAGHADWRAVGPFGGDETPAFIAAPQRMERNRKLIAGLKRGPRPASPRKVIGAHAFDTPRLHHALIVGHVQPNPTVRVRPVHLLDRPVDGNRLVHVKG